MARTRTCNYVPFIFSFFYDHFNEWRPKKKVCLGYGMCWGENHMIKLNLCFKYHNKMSHLWNWQSFNFLPQRDFNTVEQKIVHSWSQLHPISYEEFLARLHSQNSLDFFDPLLDVPTYEHAIGSFCTIIKLDVKDNWEDLIGSMLVCLLSHIFSFLMFRPLLALSSLTILPFLATSTWILPLLLVLISPSKLIFPIFLSCIG